MDQTGAPLLCCAPLASPRLSNEASEAVATLFKALGDPARIQLINRMAKAKSPVCVCDLTQGSDLAQPTVSFHLKKLLDAGLIEREQRGTWAYYSINPQAFSKMQRIFERK